MKSILIVLGLLSVQSSFADNCDIPRDDFDGLYCMNKVYIKADEDLNNAFKELKPLINAEEKKALMKSQLQWIESRNSTCSIKNTQGFFVNLNCVKSTTVERTNFLRDRIRECKATGCQISKM